MMVRLSLVGDHYKIKINGKTYAISKVDKSGYVKIGITNENHSFIIRYRSKDIESDNIFNWCNWTRPCYLRETKDIEKDWWLI